MAVDIHPTPAEMQSLGPGMAQIAPAGWTELRYRVEVVGPTSAATITALTPAGPVAVDRPMPDDARRTLRTMRRAMYRPGVGTWFTATFTVGADGRFAAEFDYDTEPSHTFDPASWAADAQRFPRAPAHIPAWLAPRGRG